MQVAENGAFAETVFWYGTCGAPVRACNHNITHRPSRDSHTGNCWRWIDHHFPIPATNSFCCRPRGQHGRQVRRRREASIPRITGEKKHNRKLTAICVSYQLAWNSKQRAIVARFATNQRQTKAFGHVFPGERFRNYRAPRYLIASALPLSDASVRDRRGTRDLRA